MSQPTVNGAAEDLYAFFRQTGQVGRTEELRLALAMERANAVTGTLDAAREHMGCACNGVEGHLAERGLLPVKEGPVSDSGRPQAPTDPPVAS